MSGCIPKTSEDFVTRALGIDPCPHPQIHQEMGKISLHVAVSSLDTIQGCGTLSGEVQ